MIQNSRYLSIETKPHAIHLTLNDDGKQALNQNNELKMTDLLEDLICNSDWETLTPEQIGALTDCDLMLSNQVDFDEHGDVTKIGNLYVHTKYEIEDPIEVLLKTGTLRIPLVSTK